MAPQNDLSPIWALSAIVVIGRRSFSVICITFKAKRSLLKVSAIYFSVSVANLPQETNNSSPLSPTTLTLDLLDAIFFIKRQENDSLGGSAESWL